MANPIPHGGSLVFQCIRNLQFGVQPNIDWKITRYSGNYNDPSLWYGSADNPNGWMVEVVSYDATGISGGVVRVYAPLTATPGPSPHYKVWAKTPFSFGSYPPTAWIYEDFGIVGTQPLSPGPQRLMCRMSSVNAMK